MQPEEQLIQERIKKLDEIRKLGINPYPYKFEAKNFSNEILEKYKKLKNEGKTKDKVSLAGRIMTLRPMGKIAFGHLQDNKGKVQFFINEKELGKKGILLELMEQYSGLKPAKLQFSQINWNY